MPIPGASRRLARFMAAGDAQTLAVDLEDLVGVHAGDVHERPGVIDFHAVRHVARRKIREGRHRCRLHDRDDVHAGVIAVKVGIRDEREGAVGRQRYRGRKHFDRRAPEQRVRAGAHLPERAVRRAVRNCHVPRRSVRGGGHVVRAIDVGGHDANRNDFHDGQRRAVPRQLRHNIPGLTGHQNAVPGRARAGRPDEAGQHGDCGDESHRKKDSAEHKSLPVLRPACHERPRTPESPDVLCRPRFNPNH